MRADANQRGMKVAAEKMGATVELIRSLRPGCPDALVGFQGWNYLWEFKVLKTGRLSEGQKAWRDSWRGGKPFVIKDIGDVLAFFQLVRYGR